MEEHTHEHDHQNPDEKAKTLANLIQGGTSEEDAKKIVEQMYGDKDNQDDTEK